MKTTRSTFMFLTLAITCFFTVASSTAYAQSTVFTNSDARTDWAAAVLGTIVEDDFESLRTTDGSLFLDDAELGVISPLQNPQSLAWGDLFGPESDSPNSFVTFLSNFGGPELPPGGLTVGPNIATSDPAPIGFTFNNPDNGALEGFVLSIRDQLAASRLEISIFEGDKLLESFFVENLAENITGFVPEDPDTYAFGWINTNNLNATRVEIAEVGDGESLTLSNARFAFFDPEPVAETCFDLLTDVRLEVAALLATSEGHDAAYLQGALSCLQWSQHDCFWEQPSGNRLSIYGSSVFIGAAYTVNYLERVNDPQADVIIDELLDVLECIVENEIDYAIANGGRESFIDRAEDFAVLGEIIDGDFDNQVVATLAYRLAWVHAYYSTY